MFKSNSQVIQSNTFAVSLFFVPSADAMSSQGTTAMITGANCDAFNRASEMLEKRANWLKSITQLHYQAHDARKLREGTHLFRYFRSIRLQSNFRSTLFFAIFSYFLLSSRGD